MGTLLTRLPFQSQYLYHWDSVNFAFGIQQFDVLNGAPQFPGYILYVALGQILNHFTINPTVSLNLISLMSSGIAVVMVYRLGTQMFSPKTGAIASLLLMSSPLVWFYGTVSLPHTLDLALMLVAVSLLFEISEGRTRWLWWTVVFLGLVGGFRQQTLLFLLPLLLYSTRRAGWRQWLLMLGLGTAVSLTWLFPLLAYSGGLRAYLEGSSAYSQAFFSTTSIFTGAGWEGLRQNILQKLLPYTLYGLSGALLLLAMIVLRWKQTRRLIGVNFQFLLAWVVPALSFYAFIHMGQQGLIFLFLPALMLVSAVGCAAVIKQSAVIVAALVVMNAAIFLFLPEYPAGESRLRLLNAATIHNSDRYWSERIQAIRESFGPQNTLLVSSNWRHVQYYLPEYPLARFRLGDRSTIDMDYQGKPVGMVDLGMDNADSWTLVLVDPELVEKIDHRLEFITLDAQNSLAYIRLKSNEFYFTDEQSIAVISP